MTNDGKEKSKEKSDTTKEGGQGEQAPTSKEEEIIDGVPYSQLVGDAGWYSDQISKSVRWLSVAVVGGIWSVLTADRIEFSNKSICDIPTATLVTWAFILAVSSLVVDLIHYAAAYWASSESIDKWKPGFEYSAKCMGRPAYGCYVFSWFFFFMKLFLALGAGLIFCLAATAIRFSHT